LLLLLLFSRVKGEQSTTHFCRGKEIPVAIASLFVSPSIWTELDTLIVVALYSLDMSFLGDINVI